MACCPCCCETKQGGVCCGAGESATCCPEGEYCCDGVCQESPCGCVDIFDCPEGQVCCDGECMTLEEYETTCLGCCCADFEGDSECIGNFIAGQCNQDLGGPAFTICDSGECNFTFTPGACPEAPPP